MGANITSLYIWFLEIDFYSQPSLCETDTDSDCCYVYICICVYTRTYAYLYITTCVCEQLAHLPFTDVYMCRMYELSAKLSVQAPQLVFTVIVFGSASYRFATLAQLSSFIGARQGKPMLI